MMNERKDSDGVVTVKEAILFAAKKVKARPNASALAFSLVSLATTASPASLLRRPSKQLSRAAQQRLRTLTGKAAHGEPLAYLRGYQEFYGLRFAVSRATLIPRPESEQIIDTALALFPKNKPLRIVDVGTGSGCLAITLLRFFPNATAQASDISRSALHIAKRNAKALKVARRISFASGNLLKAIPEGPRDLLVANLPYLPKEEAQRLHPEPLHALAGGGRRGEALILALLKQIRRRRHRPSCLILEVDPRTTRIIAKAAGRIFRHVTILKDLAGFQRVVRCAQPFLSAG